MPTGDYSLYLAWYVSEEVKDEDIEAFGEQLLERLPGKEQYLMLSVRDLRERGLAGHAFKGSVLADLERADVPVEPGSEPSYDDPSGYDREYEALLDFFEGKKCLDVNLVEF
jgi:hypothetical protein